MKKIHTTFHLILFGTLLMGQKQDTLSKSLLSNLTTKIISLKERNSYVNAELLQIFSNPGGSYWETQKEIEKIAEKPSNQKILFHFWYNKFDATNLGISRLSLLTDYFRNTLLLNEIDSKTLASHIVELNYFSKDEKAAFIKEQSSNKNKQYKEIEIQKKTFDLAIVDKPAYDDYYDKIVQNIFDYFFPKIKKETWYIEKLKIKSIHLSYMINLRFERTYILPSFWQMDNEWKEKPVEVQVEVVKGEEHFDLINHLPTDKFPFTKLEGFYVKTKADYKNILINIDRGFCNINYSKDKIKYADNEPDNKHVKNLIQKNLEGKRKGSYRVTYRIGNIDNMTIEEITIE